MLSRINSAAATQTWIQTFQNKIHHHVQPLTSRWPLTAVAASNSPPTRRGWGGVCVCLYWEGCRLPRRRGYAEVMLYLSPWRRLLEETGSKQQGLIGLFRLWPHVIDFKERKRENETDRKGKKRKKALTRYELLTLWVWTGKYSVIILFLDSLVSLSHPFDLLTSSHRLTLTSRVRQRSCCVRPVGVCV